MNVASILEPIRALFSSIRKPAQTVPAPLISVGAAARPGLSTNISTAKILKSLKDKGIPTEASPDGTLNFTNAMVVSIVEEVFRAIREDSKVQMSIMPGGAIVYTSGANGGGPLIGVGGNINFVAGEGIIQ